jgi:drug/metabolite transporter (DMT)-like permease
VLRRSNYFIVVTLTLIGTLTAALMASGVKYLSNDLNTFTICFFRCLIGLIIVLPFIIKNKFKAIKSKNIKLQFYRSFINVISMITWFSAIGIMHLEKATALGFTTPLFTTILAVIILREVIRAHRITALFIGFLGVLIIIRPGYLPIESGTLLMLIASFSFSIVLIMVKKLSDIDSSLTIIFYHLLFMTPLTFIIAIFFWEGINFSQFCIFVLMGSAGLISHWCLAQAFKLSDTTFIMPFQFTKLIWASFIGYVIFAESPDKWTWFGGIVIFASVIYIAYREAFIKQRDPSTKQINRAIIN